MKARLMIHCQSIKVHLCFYYWWYLYDLIQTCACLKLLIGQVLRAGGRALNFGLFEIMFNQLNCKLNL